MDKQFDRTNTGTLGRNKNRPSEQYPEYSGSINVEGVEYWISGRVKTAGPNAKEPGEKFFSLYVKPKNKKPKADPAPAPVSEEGFNDDIPF